jgi:hypothetical protein
MRDQSKDREKYQAGELRRFYSGGLEPMEANMVIERRSCVGACGRVPSVASSADYLYWCCPRCVEGGHSSECERTWPYLQGRELA